VVLVATAELSLQLEDHRRALGISIDVVELERVTLEVVELLIRFATTLRAAR